MIFIHLLILDFSRFFNNFNDTEIAQIFMYFSDFVKNNPIEVFIFKDDTERTLSFVESFQKFSKNLNDIYRFYMDKHFNNIEVKNIIYKAYETGNDQITSIIEDPNFILKN